MKRTVSLICAVFMLLCALSLSACGGKDDLSGTYKLVEVISQGQDLTEQLTIVGDVILTIDGSKAELSVGTQNTEFTVDTEKGVFMDDADSSTPYKLEGDRLTLENTESESKMVFEKQTATPDEK